MRGPARPAALLTLVALATACGSTSGEQGSPGHLVVPSVVDLPYVLAGAGGSQLAVTLRNDGDRTTTGLAFTVTGAASIHVASAPISIGGRGSATVVLSYDGAAQEEIAEAALHVSSAQEAETVVPVFGVAGDPGLGDAGWETVTGAQAVTCGEGATVAMPAAPFPDGASTWSDPSVRVFVPEGYRDRGAQDFVLHFHGHSTTVASTLAAHRLQEHLHASGANALLVVPQGPVDAASGDFGKLMDPQGTRDLLREVLVLLYRDGRVTHPRVGEVVLTSSGGGYQAVAANLGSPLLSVGQVGLFDSMYGATATFEAFAGGGGRLRSNYTPSGGTTSNNLVVAADLASTCITSSAPTQRALRDARAVIYSAATQPAYATRWDGAFGEWLRWGLSHHRRGPRAALRSVVHQGAQAELRWLSPRDEDLTGWLIETSSDGVTWSTAGTAAAADEAATIPLGAGVRVRLRPVVAGVALGETQPTNAYRVDPGAQVLVVDRFDRVLDGRWGGLAHDFSAVVGEAVPGGVATVHHRALTEDAFSLAAYRAVIWLSGDSASLDHTLDFDERTLVTEYIAGGGHLVASGTEIAFDLAGGSGGTSFLEGTLGATYVADDSGSYDVTGAGALSALGALTFGGTGAPYAADYMDALGAAPGGEVVLAYGNAMGAAAGLPGSAVLVGFPLELIDTPAARAEAVAALLGFATGP